MSTHKRLAPQPAEDIYSTNQNAILLTPGAYTRIDDWMHAAVNIACGETAQLIDVVLFAIVYNLTHDKTPTMATRGWFAARLSARDLDTVTASAEHLAAAGLIIKEHETKARIKKDPVTGCFVRTDVPLTNWRLSVNENSPALKKALAWERGELDEERTAAIDKGTPVLELNEARAWTNEFFDEFFDLEIVSAFTTDDGHFDFAKIAEVIKAGLAAIGNVDTESTNVEDDPEGWEELANVTCNTNRLAEAKDPYRAFLDEGYEPDVILAAWVARQKGLKKEMCPQLVRWLQGEGSCAGSDSARACIAREEERRSRISGVVAVDDDDTLNGFSPDAYKSFRGIGDDEQPDVLAQEFTAEFLRTH